MWLVLYNSKSNAFSSFNTTQYFPLDVNVFSMDNYLGFGVMKISEKVDKKLNFTECYVQRITTDTKMSRIIPKR